MSTDLMYEWINPTANNGSVGVYFKNIPSGAGIKGYSLFLADNGEFNKSLGNTFMTLHITDGFGAPIYQKKILLTLGETLNGTLYWYGGEIFREGIILTTNGVSLGSAFLPAPCAGITGGPYIISGAPFGGTSFSLATALAVMRSA